MYGVVLWSDTEEKKAVIWCEDHGDLAFYNANEEPQQGLPEGPDGSVFDGFAMDAGDLVYFEIREKRHLRYVQNPRLISEDEYPTLAQGLNHAAPPTGAPQAAQRGAVRPTGSAEVIPFNASARKRAAAPNLAMSAG